MQGWISIHRQIKEHWLYQEKRTFSKYEAWLDLLMTVNHADNKFVLGSELVEVKRGSTITSIRKLCDAWGWSNTKVKKFLDLLQADKMIAYKSDTKKTLLSIENYDLYQKHEKEKRHENDTKTSQKHHENTQTIMFNTVNNENKEDIGEIEEVNIYRKHNHLSITNAEKEKIEEKYNRVDIDSYIDRVFNYNKNKKYNSLNLTVRSWIRKDKDNYTKLPIKIQKTEKEVINF